MGAKQSTLQDTIIDMKLATKQLQSASKKAEKEEKAERLKVKKAIEKGNKDGAHIYAGNAIRKKNEALNYLRLSAKMDAVVSKLETAEKTTAFSNQMGKVVPQLDKALKNMSPEQIAVNMDKFEKLFEDLDVRTEYMSTAIDGTTAQTQPAEEVDSLIRQVGEEHALEVNGMLQDAPIGQAPIGAVPQKAAAAPAPAAVEEDPLAARLAKLKEGS